MSTIRKIMKAAGAIQKETLNKRVLKAQYAVRGELVQKSMEYKKALEEGKSLPFNKIISCNIGNPQAVGQTPVTWPRQVLALLNCPFLLNDASAASLFPSDVRDRAQLLVDNIPGGVGAYSDSQGVFFLRKGVADFIARRDGHPADPNQIFLTGGASPGVHLLLRSLIRDENDAILVPVPQYPLYSAGITLYGGTRIDYFLDEEKGWGMTVSELERSLAEARSAGKVVRSLAVINPGNPTGQCLPEENMQEVIRFCAREGILLMADEVYQENIWQQQQPWVSFKKVLRDLQQQEPENEELASMQLASFHSVSKGFLGECGRRGGYVEFVGLDTDVLKELYKVASISLCSNVEGQVMTYLMCNPPVEGEPSHELYAHERDTILKSLHRRAGLVSEAYNKLEGVTCNHVEGALYAFPQITIPRKAVEAAEAAGKTPDTFYCLALLDATGVVVVPGSGFGQRPGTWHFRSTILPQEDCLEDMIVRTAAFHAEFMDKYRDNSML